MANKFTNFTIHQTTYKTINNHPIRADILIPKDAPASAATKRPLIVRYHGGGLIMGDSLFEMFFPRWLLDLATTHNAIIVSPNYRLLPETTSPEIYTDIEDFWSWLHSATFSSLLSSTSGSTSGSGPVPVEADLNRILLAGDSAGGLLSIYTALAHPKEIRSATASYPWINPSSENFKGTRKNPPFGNSTPESVYLEYMAALQPGAIKSSVSTPESLTLMLSAGEHGHLSTLYERGTEGVDKNILYPTHKIEEGEGNVDFPVGGIAIIHGRQDSVVPVEDVEEFVDRARVIGGNLALEGPGVTLTIRDGEHGFDGDLRFDEEEWLREAFGEAVRVWLE